MNDVTKWLHHGAVSEKLYLARCGRDYEHFSRECWRRPLPWSYIPHLHRTTGLAEKSEGTRKDMYHHMTWLVLDFSTNKAKKDQSVFWLLKVGEVCWRWACVPAVGTPQRALAPKVGSRWRSRSWWTTLWLSRQPQAWPPLLANKGDEHTCNAKHKGFVGYTRSMCME